MPCRLRLLVVTALLAASVLAPGLARAQEAGTGSATVNSALPNPYRALFQGGQYVDVTNSPRPQNLNPTGANFLDCEQDLKLTFPLTISGFTGGVSLEAWAGPQDCTQDGARGIGQTAVCWRVGQQGNQILSSTLSTISVDVYARDVLRYENVLLSSQSVAPYDGSFHNGSQGEGACHTQATDAAVTISIYFIPINIGAGTATGTAYKFAFITDLVAPPAPFNVGLGAGDTLLKVNWTSPGNDPDIVGYSLYSDPPAGGVTTGGCSCGSNPGGGASSYAGPGEGGTGVTVDASVLVCDSSTDGPADGPQDAPGDAPEAGDDGAVSSEASLPEASADGAADAGLDAGTDAVAGTDAGVDAGDDGGGADAGDGGIAPGCHVINQGGGGSGCDSFNLTGNVTIVGGTTTTSGDSGTDASTIVPITTGDDGGGSDGGVTLSGGGIAQIDPAYKAGEIDDRSATALTLTGLVDGTNYVVVVASVDGSGNVGPPSTPTCGVPAKVTDFWAEYKGDGGGASGCALEGDGTSAQTSLLGIGLAATLLAMARRRGRR